MDTGESLVKVDNVETESQAQELGLDAPSSLAVLPFNYYSADTKADLKFDIETVTVNQLIEDEGYDPEEIVDFSEGPATEAWSAGGIGPVVYFGADMLVQNWQAVLSVVSVLGSWYLSQGGDNAVLNVVTEDKQIHYEGPAEEMEPVLTEALREKRDEIAENGKEDQHYDDKESDSA